MRWIIGIAVSGLAMLPAVSMAEVQPLATPSGAVSVAPVETDRAAAEAEAAAVPAPEAEPEEADALTLGIPAAALPDVTPAEKPEAEQPAEKTAADKTRRCTVDNRSCISVATYVADVCSVIERAAGENRLDPNFLARLLWKESMFEPEAVSPVGALGIAQFMPETAKIRKLDDPFNPAKAIHASADYLRYLIDGFGNIGLAAVAYNGGEARAARFHGGGHSLPFETLDYVEAITGYNAWRWRDDEPTEVDIRLDKDTPFRDACMKLAKNRTLKEFSTPQRVYPWGVILASHPKQSGAKQQVSRLNRQLRPILGGKRISFVPKKLGGTGRRVYTAQVGYSSRKDANTFCTQLRALGGRCIVLKN